MLYGLLDRLAERYSEGEHKLEAMRAREEYFERAGKVFDDDAELFEGRMASFLEWYVLERPMAATGVPPVARALAGSDEALPGAERRVLASLAATHRSLFELHGIADHLLDVEDLVGGARFAVRERRNPLGMTAGDVFEARLCWDGEAVVFGRTFLFHPPGRARGRARLGPARGHGWGGARRDPVSPVAPARPLAPPGSRRRRQGLPRCLKRPVTE